jgi:hypothetical protein
MINKKRWKYRLTMKPMFFVAVVDGQWTPVDRLFPFLDEAFHSELEPFFDVAFHGGCVDFILDLYVVKVIS